jgi:putative ABC transport system permease protein
MNYTELFKSAITALKSNILRTALTMLGIVIGITAVILILIISQGTTAFVNGRFSSLGPNLLILNSSDSIKLTLDDAKALKDPNQIQNVSEVSTSYSGSKTVIANGENTSVAVMGVSDTYQTVLSLEMDKGEFISSDDVSAISRVTVLGPQVVTDLFGEGADPIGQTIDIASKPFRVVGVAAAKSSNTDDLVYIPVTTSLRVLFGADHVQSIYINAKDSKLLDDTISDAKQIIFERHSISDQAVKDRFRIFSSRDILSTINSVLSILTLVLSGIAAISLIVGGIGIMNIMLVTVTERTKEIGLLKAIGAKRNDILIQFLIESVVLTVSGGIIGIIFGIGIGYILSNVFKVPFGLPLVPIFGAVSISVVIGVLFGSYPAYSAAKMSPIDALHYE